MSDLFKGREKPLILVHEYAWKERFRVCLWPISRGYRCRKLLFMTTNNKFENFMDISRFFVYLSIPANNSELRNFEIRKGDYIYSVTPSLCSSPWVLELPVTLLKTSRFWDLHFHSQTPFSLNMSDSSTVTVSSIHTPTIMPYMLLTLRWNLFIIIRDNHYNNNIWD